MTRPRRPRLAAVRVLVEMLRRGPVTVLDLCIALDMDRNNVRNALDVLREHGYVEIAGTGPRQREWGGYPYLWRQKVI